MASKEHSETEHTHTDTLEPTPIPPLRREAILTASERQRGIWMAACCGLAGVAMGFGMGAFSAVARNPCLNHHVVMERTSAPQPWLGVDMDSDHGARITHVYPGSPAERAGLEVGDVVVSLAEQPVTSSRDLVMRVREAGIGANVRIVVRDRELGPVQTVATLGGITPRALRHLLQHR